VKSNHSSLSLVQFLGVCSRLVTLPASFVWLGGGPANAQAPPPVYDVTSIGQPLSLTFGTAPGNITFTGDFLIGAENSYNYLGMRTLLGLDSVSGVLGTEETYSYGLSNFKLTGGNHLSSLPFDWQVKHATTLTTSAVSASNVAANVNWLEDPETLSTLRTLNSTGVRNYGLPDPLGNINATGSIVRVAPITATKSFDFSTIQGSANIQFSNLFPQGASAVLGLQITDTLGTGTPTNQNTDVVQVRVQPGTVSPSSFSTASTSMFRWDLKGNTTAGAGTNWTQINFANQVATFAEGTQFVIAFDDTTDFLDGFWSQNRSWDIFNGGTISGDGAGAFLANLDFIFTGGLNRPADIPNGYNTSHFSFDQSTGTLNWTAIPEPTSALSGIILAAGLMRRRRR
jgi:hypothetical protein